MPVKDREELKETIAEYFLDLDPEKTLVSQFKGMWAQCNYEQREEIKKVLLKKPIFRRENLNGKPKEIETSE